MSEKNNFKQATDKYLAMLEQYVPVVDRVHGDSHPEFHEVRRIFNQMADIIKAAVDNRPELEEILKEMRSATNNYKVPEDVCESYEAVYMMLETIDQAYND